MASKQHKPKKNPGGGGATPQPGQTFPTGDPHFGEPKPTPDPTSYVDQKSDVQYYNFVNRHLLQPVPPPRDPTNVVLTLAQALGTTGAAQVARIAKSGKVVFHCAGDTGPVNGPGKGPQSLNDVVDKMVADFQEANPADVPSFFYHLGDVIYSFGEAEYYYDQFYAPYRDYNAPIFAIPGNHDGVTYKGDPAASLEAFLRTFCAPAFQKTPESGSLWRTSMIQPGVFFTLDAPFVRILGLYSNVLEDPGVISSQGTKGSPVDDKQLQFLNDELSRIKKEKYTGAVLLAVHHPPFTGGAVHGGSPLMSLDMDNAFKATGVYPHAVLSGHAHNYQRYTRLLADGSQTPYIVAGSGGHGISPLSKGSGGAVRTPVAVNKQLTFELYFSELGSLRIVVTAAFLSIEFHSAAAGTASKTPVDVVTVDLKQRKLTAQRP